MREKGKMNKGDKKSKDDSMNLQKMYEQGLTPERKVEAFRRYVIKLKRQRNFGRDLNYLDYMQADIRLFREEALYMKGLNAEYDMHVRLLKEIRCLEEMSDEQILCYYTLVKRFQNNLIERADMLYARYYLLEVANLIYHETPQEACETMFSFWDALNGPGKVSLKTSEYFYTICRLFMLAFPELMPQMIDRLEEQTGRDWSGRAYEAVEKGDYESVGRFVMQNARNLKENERFPEKDYAVHAWKALPYVFRMLEQELESCHFRHMILNGFYASVYIGEYPVMCGGKREKETVWVSKYMYYEYQDYSDYWKFWYYVLRESVQDLLCTVYQYTESRMRWYLKAHPRKGSLNRIISKAYATGTDRPQDVARIKEMLKDDRFREAVENGVLDYLTTEDVDLPARKVYRSRRASRKAEQEMDHEEVCIPAAIDRQKLKQAKEDAESVLGMLSEGEIAYQKETADSSYPEAAPLKAASENSGIGKNPGQEKPGSFLGTPHTGEELVCTWNEAEKQYLRFLRAGDDTSAGKHLHALQIPENIMIKNINNKALEFLGDLLLEKEAGVVRILEDYEEEADRILGERL